MGARDNLNSSGHNIVNCSQTTVTTPSSQAVNLKLNKGIAVATSPLLENGKGGGGGGGSIGGGSGGGSIGGCGAGSITHERSLTSQSPHDFRKDFEHNMENGKGKFERHFCTLFLCDADTRAWLAIACKILIFFST